MHGLEGVGCVVECAIDVEVLLDGASTMRLVAWDLVRKTQSYGPSCGLMGIIQTPNPGRSKGPSTPLQANQLCGIGVFHYCQLV